MKKRIRYQTVSVQAIESERMRSALGGAGQTCIVALDIAKQAMVAGFANAQGRCEKLVRFSHPTETLVFLGRLEMLRELGLKIEVAMEPTGVYGDALRYQLLKRGFEVYRVDPTRSHAMASVLDGVPSLHDAKSCTLIAHLHAHQLSTAWRDKSVHERELRALLREYELYSDPFERNRGLLEGYLGTHFPELFEHVDSKSTWHLRLLLEFGSPARIAAARPKATALLRRVSRGALTPEKIDAIINAAQRSLGESMSEGEVRGVQALVRCMLEQRERMKEVRKRIRAYVNELPELAPMVETFGPVTTAALVADLGDPANYGSSAAFEKALGLNLKEKSSGNLVGQVHITKRGPSRSRRYLYLAALRLVKSDPVVRAWYQARSSYKANHKLKAVVAVMRKLARALVHLARGHRFDARKLFDCRRLQLPDIAERIEPSALVASA